MNVVHVVGGDLARGAHRGAYWQHQGLRQIGVNSAILGPVPRLQQDDGIASTSGTAFGRLKDSLIARFDRVIVRAYAKRSDWAFSSGLFGRRLVTHPLIRQADVINLHWVSKGPLSVHGIGKLATLGRPIVWTLRDMWPFTGGCHYSMDCDRYTDACGRCPQLGSTRDNDLSRLVWAIKRKRLSNRIAIVGISEWLSDCARRSMLFRDFDIRTIPNCVDTELFTPVEKTSAREALGIRTNKRIVLVGAGNVTSFYKGFDIFVRASRYLDSTKVLVLLFGDARSIRESDIPLEVVSAGYLEDDRSLRLAYSAADVFVAPSRQEAFGKTLVEAMSCGTPVVCFDAGGPKDIVTHKVTGYKAEPFEPDDLARGIAWVLENAYLDDFRPTSLHRAAAKYDKRSIALSYSALYEELLRRYDEVH